MKTALKIIVGFVIWFVIVAKAPDDISLGITILLIWLGLFFLLFKAHKNTKKQQSLLPFYHIAGIQFLNPNELLNLEILDTSIILCKGKQKIFKEISIKSINNVLVLQEIENTEENKSVIGRGIVGGLLLGPIGAIVGGMSGVGTKTKSQTDYYLEISYDNNKVVLKPFMNNENIANKVKTQIIEKIEAQKCL